ncbi:MULTISPECIES: LLM class flavin-dependent oxidoreductase [unclassified Paenibacillus]|uniref:LLM class flavin-dependent oxidoreductase n=1 Tax=unclassified Paenibacillus TaxID=185978 RepID=UPI00191595DA|nr:LLM class flavin-dependent oxidoreductase [Paenibacillus sp. EPM92]
MNDSKPLHLAVFLAGPGLHAGGWRHPDTHADRLLDLSFYHEFAKISERGLFDTIMLVEQIAIGESHGKVVEERPIPTLDTVTVLAAMAAVTEKIGLTATLSTTYNDPFHVALRFAALDYISGGRAGWNIVTSQDARVALNFSQEAHLDHALRYRRAGEFVDVVKKFWDSWEDDALLAETRTGAFYDIAKVHDVDHAGEFFNISGKAYTPRPIQGYPVLFQAGSSESGKQLAAQHAEAIYTAQDNLEEAQVFYEDLKGLLGRYGRRREQLLILPGFSPVLGSTESEAKELERQFNEFVHPEYAVKLLSGLLNVDLSTYPIDGPVPIGEINVAASHNKSRVQLLKDLAERERLTIRQLSKHVVAASGHYSFVGTPEQLADLMEAWIDQGACDGFTIMPSHYLRGLEDFVDHVVPILQQRGRYRTAYSGSTLRDHLGLERPANRWSNATASGVAAQT